MKIEEEHKLIVKAQSDIAFFEPIYDHYYLPIYYFIAKRTNNNDLAGEITSVVFLKALENIKKFNFQGLPFSAWLYRIAQNTLIDMYRKNKAQHIINISSQQLESIAMEIELKEDEEQLNSVIKLIPTLKEAEIILLELRFFEQRRFKEIAEILVVSEETARVRVHRLITKMKKKLNVKHKV